MLSLRRRYSRWRMFSILLFLGIICSGELTPIRVLEETSSASSSTAKKKDIGSLSDYWQAWLVMDTPGLQHGFDSTTLLRRITPKSVFIAPELPACAEGYHADSMGRCVKSIRINATAHKDFILERLKNIFRNPQVPKNDQKKSTGPLQLNIPLVSDISQSSNTDENKPIAVPTRNETRFTENGEKTKPHETDLYEVKNDTTLDEEESTLFLENSNIDNVGKTDRKPPATVPIAELIEKPNDTNFSKVVDYTIQIDLKTLLNSSSVKRVNASDGIEDISIAEKRENSTEMAPALVLLISPTKLTNVLDDLSLTQNDTAEQIAQVSNLTSNTTTKENITISAPDSTVLPPTKQSTSIPLDEQRDNETYAEDELTPETSKPNESQEADFYDEEEDDIDYPYSTDIPDDEDSTEGDEILKHGEAGMTIPTRDVKRNRDRDHSQRERNQTADLQKMLDINDQVMIRFNDSASMEDKDEPESNVSSEVSIDGDFILETTLLDVNTERLQVATQSPDVTEKIVKSSEDGFKISLGKSPDIVPEVVFSQDVHGAVSTNSHGRERTEQISTRIENERNEELEAAPSSSESLYDSPEENPITEIRTINEKRLKENTSQASSKDFQLNVPVSSSKRTTMNLDSAEDFVRFPDYAKQPQQSNYVRFPSSEANSIHNQSYKQNRYTTDDVGPYGSTSTKSSVPIRQKPVYYLTPSSWKLDRSQPDHIQVTASDRQTRRPDLIHFWRKMPLIRDPAIYPFYLNDETDDNKKQSYNRFFRTRSSRRLSSSTETSSENRVSMQKQRMPIDV